MPPGVCVSIGQLGEIAAIDEDNPGTATAAAAAAGTNPKFVWGISWLTFGGHTLFFFL